MSLIISNTQLLTAIDQALIQTGLQADIQARQYSDTKMIVRARFNDVETLAGEEFRRQLYLFNWNDGKHALRLNVGLYRLVCTNGLMMPISQDSASHLRIVHRECKPTLAALAELPQLLVNGFNVIAELSDSIEDMKAIPILNNEHAFNVIGNLNVSDKVKYRSMYTWANSTQRRPADSENNAWSLYNIVNESIRLYHGEMRQVSIKQDIPLFNDVQLLAVA